MKVRTDFVTNSSSSSYIIAFKDIEPITDGTKSFQNIIQYVLNYEGDYGDTREAQRFDSIKEFRDYLIDNFCLDENFDRSDDEDDKALAELYNEACEYFKKGYSIYDKCVSNSDEFLQDIIEKLSKEETCFSVIDEV